MLQKYLKCNIEGIPKRILIQIYTYIYKIIYKIKKQLHFTNERFLPVTKQHRNFSMNMKVRER